MSLETNSLAPANTQPLALIEDAGSDTNIEDAFDFASFSAYDLMASMTGNGSAGGDSAQQPPFSYEQYYQDTIAFENMIGIVVPTVFALIIAVGLIGNVLVILVVCRNHQMQNSTNTLIINLAISDLLFLILCVPFTAADYALPIWVFSLVWCKILNYLQFVSAYASVWTLVLMSIDRFLAVVFPVQSMSLRTVRNTVASVVVLWCIILVTNAPVAWIHDIHSYVFIKEDRSTCTFVAQITLNASDIEVKAYYFTFNAFGYILPLGIACILYVFMLRKLWYRMPTSIGKKSEESIRAKRKVTWMVTGVIVTFAICWFPLNLCFSLTGWSYTQGRHPTGVTASKEFVIFQVTAQVLAYSNSCLNPILYAFLSENFRKAFVKIFGFLFCCRPMGAVEQLNASQADFDRTDNFRMTTTATTGLCTTSSCTHNHGRCRACSRGSLRSNAHYSQQPPGPRRYSAAPSLLDERRKLSACEEIVFSDNAEDSKQNGTAYV